MLWYFTDETRPEDPLAIAATLPPFLCGIVFRHDSVPHRAALGAQLARLCRARHIPLVVAGNARLAAALHAGIHLRGGAWPGLVRPPGLRTASAHNARELRAARQAGAAVVFVSPIFPTTSHPSARPLGPARCRGTYALGGITGATARALPRSCAGAGAISAFK